MDSEDQRSDDSSVEGAAMEPESDNSDEELLLNILPKRRKISVRYGSSSSSSEEKALVDADRISALPDSLLHHILSFLQTKHAAKTSLLSKRWHPLWTFNSVLKFRDPDYYHDCPYGTGLSQFVTCIHRTLILHQSPKIEKLLVQFDYRKRFSSDVDVWVRFAARKNVEELGLNFYSDRLGDEDVYDDDSVPYVLPLSLFSVSSLVTLKLSRCEFGPHRGVISWKALKVLSLSEMSLSNDSIRDVLSGSPSLELLEFHDCWGFDFVYIKSVRLRKVVIDKYGRDWNPDSVSSLKILAAKVRSLEITGYLKTHKICVITSCYLVEAKLDFHMPSDSPGSYCIQEEYPKILKELFPNLNHVEDLTVGSRFLKAHSSSLPFHGHCSHRMPLGAVQR